jgi:cytochrome-b5 reductase
LYCNRTENDILLREELENMAAKNPERLQITYCLSQPPLNWEQESGRVSLDMVKKHMPEPNANVKIFVCGPDKMVSTVTSSGRGWTRGEKGILQQ